MPFPNPPAPQAFVQDTPIGIIGWLLNLTGVDNAGLVAAYSRADTLFPAGENSPTLRLESPSKIGNSQSFLDLVNGRVQVPSQGQLVPIVTPEFYGAVGDGLTDDWQAFNNAVNALSGARGGIVLCSRKTYALAQTLVVPPNVWIVGQGARASRLIALAGFTGTTMLWLGTTGVRSFNCGVDAIQLDAADIVNTCVYSDSINEKCGVRNIMCRRFLTVGVDIESAVSGSNGLAQNFVLDGMELYHSTLAVAPIDLRMVSTSATRDFAQGVTHVTCNCDDGITTIAGSTGIVIDGYVGTPFSGLHTERVTTGVSIGPNRASHGTSLTGVWGSSTVTDLVRIEATAGDGISIFGVIPTGATHTLVDVQNGVTNTDSRLGMYCTGPGNAVQTTSNTSPGRQASPFRFAGNIGFYGTAPGAKPVITGSRGGNAALASLLTGLAGLGLFTDNSTP